MFLIIYCDSGDQILYIPSHILQLYYAKLFRWDQCIDSYKNPTLMVLLTRSFSKTSLFNNALFPQLMFYLNHCNTFQNILRRFRSSEIPTYASPDCFYIILILFVCVFSWPWHHLLGLVTIFVLSNYVIFPFEVLNPDIRNAVCFRVTFLKCFKLSGHINEALLYLVVVSCQK